MNLYQLSKTILLLNKAPINKVRFARVIYFVHKELIRKKFMSAEDIAYIRSPLGPVPDGMLKLTLDHPNIITNPASDRPSFAAEEYTIKLSDAEEDEETVMLEQYREVLKAVERTLKALAEHTTPELVQASHSDPSWIANFNGARYFITPADLKNPFPFNTIRVKIRIKRAPQNELGALQANLLRGMMQDIVKESTDLEYPDQQPKSTPESATSTPKLTPLGLIATLPFLKHITVKPTKPTAKPSKSPENPAVPTNNSPETAFRSSETPVAKPDHSTNNPPLSPNKTRTEENKPPRGTK